MVKSIKENKKYLISLVTSIIIALLIGAILMIVTGYNPLDGYGAMLKGTFGSLRVFGNMLTKMITLCLTALAMAVAAKAGMFNVGGEGQLFLGGLAAALVGIYVGNTGIPVFIGVILAFLAAMAAGGFYGFIPAVLRTRLGVSEVITTIMLNSVAIYFCGWCVSSGGPFITDDKGVLGGSEAINSAYAFSQIIPRSNLSTAVIYSAVIAFLCWFLMQKTNIGLDMKITGENPKFGFFSGIKTNNLMVWSMIASGAICGLVGMFEVYGYQTRFMSTISNEFYYDGMLVAMIMNYNPLGIIIMSFFFAIIDIGASQMELSVGISKELSDIIFAVIIFLMAARKDK